MVAEEKKQPTMAQLRNENAKLKEENAKLKNSIHCCMCGKMKLKNQFYRSSDPRYQLGYVPICKACATNIARRVTEDGEPQEPTKASVMTALEYLDKPFLTKVWDSSYFESNNTGSRKAHADIWANYIKNISMPNYSGMRWKDSDIFKSGVSLGKLDMALPTTMEQDVYEQEERQRIETAKECEANRQDVIKFVGYDPFENYPNAGDKPMLYASLISFIDEDSKNDGMKMRAIIQIVKTYNQIEKLNDTIDLYVNDAVNLSANTASLDKLSGVVKRLNDAAVSLAKDNGISVNNNNNKSKGANTLSGKIKQLTEIGYRNAEINAFDYETCEGMRQVAELSEEARHKQIGYDENIAQEIKDIKVELVESLTKERDAALESMRLALRENLDLKQTLRELSGDYGLQVE